MGRVLETYEGSNDVFRVVKLNTALGKTIRGREGGREGGREDVTSSVTVTLRI